MHSDCFSFINGMFKIDSDSMILDKLLNPFDLDSICRLALGDDSSEESLDKINYDPISFLFFDTNTYYCFACTLNTFFDFSCVDSIVFEQETGTLTHEHFFTDNNYYGAYYLSDFLSSDNINTNDIYCKWLFIPSIPFTNINPFCYLGSKNCCGYLVSHKELLKYLRSLQFSNSFSIENKSLISSKESPKDCLNKEEIDQLDKRILTYELSDYYYSYRKYSLIDFFDNKCPLCSSQLTGSVNESSEYFGSYVDKERCAKYSCVDIHHIIPKANGGKDTVDNLIPLCLNCHRALHAGLKNISSSDLRSILFRAFLSHKGVFSQLSHFILGRIEQDEPVEIVSSKKELQTFTKITGSSKKANSSSKQISELDCKNLIRDLSTPKIYDTYSKIRTLVETYNIPNILVSSCPTPKKARDAIKAYLLETYHDKESVEVASDTICEQSLDNKEVDKPVCKKKRKKRESSLF